MNERDGNWMDKHGACKVCDGEIPYGHTDNCDIWKLEKELRELNALFTLQSTRTVEATRLWREATGRHHVSPRLRGPDSVATIPR